MSYTVKHLHLLHHGNMSVEVCCVGHDHPVLDVSHAIDCFHHLAVVLVDAQFRLCWCQALVIFLIAQGLLVVFLYKLFKDFNVCKEGCHGNHWVNHQICCKVCSFCCVGWLEETCRGDWGKILWLWHELRGVYHHNDFVETSVRAFTSLRFVTTITFTAIANM